MGVVCSDVKPAIRPNESSRVRMTSLLCPVDNVILHYKAEKLRLIGVSDVLPHVVTAVAADRSGVYAASGTTVAVMKTCRHVDRYIEVEAETKFMEIIGDYLVIIDTRDGIRVFDVADGQKILTMEGSKSFQISAMVHPSTYLYKIVVGSSTGSLRLINFRTGRIIHEFAKGFDAAVTVLEQSPAIDTICKFRHEKAISAVGFRNDGKPYMTSADVGGDIVVWDLEKRQLIGKITNVHNAAVTKLYFMLGEPVMVSASADNSLRTWVLDGADGMPRQLVILEGHAEELTSVQFNGKQEIYSLKRDTFHWKVIRLPPVIDLAIGWSREAAWDNVLCRHANTLVSLHGQPEGMHKEPISSPIKDFHKDAALSQAIATAITLFSMWKFCLHK
ncbi:hypothetical protein KIN20_018625 [Parelaphostrongylus tenuis]|uniref:WDR36/Utp21 N-terminal domain-containing protein n=1 Tax=Parelaphostrongylus tenuis TaxID=148309 RepID=A0AAD5QS92_PARTN|nr:hypothetical protein KIN20_018625 [Parelaphostrongylus tenuis]